MGYVRSTPLPRSRLSCVGFDSKKAQDDDDENESCEQQLDLADNRKKALGLAEKDDENAIAKAKEARETLTDEIKALEKGIKELDESMVEAIEEHKEETNLWPLTQTRKNS